MEKMKIMIWSDFVCPFCYIGQAHLYKALKGFENAEKVDIEYKSFILSPDAQYSPGQDYFQHFAEMKGIFVDEARAMFKQVTDMGLSAGVNINYDLAKDANTYDAHRVLQYAKELGKGADYTRRFYKAFFSEGEILSDKETIIRLSEEVGMEGEKVKSILDGDEYAENADQDIYESRLIGVNSVPFFVFNNKYSLSGAQPVQEFSRMLEKVWKEEKAE
ncbi:MAG: DsbA family oxidoreductase [Christensenellales bacterium]|jgi:predicted DsbA family dithiol-disulfide isomerase